MTTIIAGRAGCVAVRWFRKHAIFPAIASCYAKLDAPDGEADDVWRRSRLAAPVPLSVPPRGFVRASPAKYPDRPNRDLSANALLLHLGLARKTCRTVADCGQR